jgi:hypothetical protein
MLKKLLKNLWIYPCPTSYSSYYFTPSVGRKGITVFDVNIIVKKVNEKNPLEVLIKRPVPLVPGTGLSHLLSHAINRLFPITVV